MQIDKLFELYKDRKSQAFSFDNSHSYISIKKIVIVSLFGNKPNEWSSKLMSSNPYLKISCTKSSGETLEYPVLIASLISTFHTQPVFEFQGDFIIPEQNILNKPDSYTYFEHAKIELCFSGNEDTDLKLTVLYTTTPGANAIQ